MPNESTHEPTQPQRPSRLKLPKNLRAPESAPRPAQPSPGSRLKLPRRPGDDVDTHSGGELPKGAPAQGESMQPGEVLEPNTSIASLSGEYVLVYQSDGNLVLYAKDGTPLWASNTAGSNAGVCIMQHDGNLVIHDATAKPIWASGSDQHPGSALKVQNDGNVVIYRSDATPVWASNTARP